MDRSAAIAAGRFLGAVSSGLKNRLSSVRCMEKNFELQRLEGGAFRPLPADQPCQNGCFTSAFDAPKF